MQEKALVLGLGISGKGAADFLLDQEFLVTGIDRKGNDARFRQEMASLLQRGMLLVSEEDPIHLSSFSKFILSPGISSSHPLVQRAKQDGLEVIGEIELGFRYLKNPCIAITGTNGKTTTVLMMEHLFRQFGKKGTALGNVGVSFCGALKTLQPDEWIFLELSSFQLETIQTKALEAGVILNLTPNHLNWHPSMESYAKAKLKMKDLVKTGGTLFVSSQVAQEYGKDLPQYEIFSIEGMDETVAAAWTLCRQFEIEKQEFLKALQGFKKPSHRMEWVKEIRGVSYYNDSKASNVGAVVYAFSKLANNVILLAGGVDKGGSYRSWIEGLKSKVKKIIAFGEAKEKIANELGSYFVVEKKETLAEALKMAYDDSVTGDTVLLSPGCSSFDQFQNYEDRGDTFKKLVNNLQ